MKIFFLTCLFLLSLTSTSQSIAQNNIDVFELDVETLLNIEVVITSKRNETVIEAPGIVTVFTKEDIKLYGGKSLMEVISRLPNVSITRIPFMPTGTGPDIRGQTPEGTPNHILTLIDGRPFRESQLGGWNQTFYQSFPLETVERIELIRGPGSVLYGTNAVSGVINIVTKKPAYADETSLTYLSTGYGSFNTKLSDASYRMHDPGSDFTLASAVKYYDTRGWDYNMVDLNGIADEDGLGRDALGGFARIQYKNLTVTGFTGRTKNDTQGLTAIWPMGIHKQKRNFLDIGYVQRFENGWQASFNTTYNGFENFADIRETITDDNEFNDFLYEASIGGPLYKEKLNIIAGAIYDDRQGSLKLGSTKYKEAMENYYFQADFKARTWLKLIGGVQLNKPESFESYDSSFRAGAIVNFTTEIGAKLLYGEAFRAPAASETMLDIPNLIGNQDLKSEEITTKEAQIFYNTPRYYAAATYYESDVENPIFTAPNPNAPPLFPFTFINDNTLEYRGFEFEGKAYLTEKFEAQGSLTYQLGKNSVTNNRDVTLAPHLMIKLGGSYISDRGFSIGVFNQYIGDTVGYSTIALPTAKPNPTVDNTNLLTANISIDLNRVFDLPNTSREISFNLYGDNLLDEEIFVPEVVDGVANNTLPGYSGRAFYASLNIRL